MKVKEHAKELASLLGSVDPTASTPTAPVPSNIVDDTPEELTPEPAFEFNYEKMKKYYFKKAKESIKKIVRVVIDDDTLIDKSFIADKIDQDAEQLSQLYYQQRKTEVMQEANMESVRTGNISPRMFETFSVLGKNLMDISKQISDFQISIKENYAKIKFDAFDESPDPKMFGTGMDEINQIPESSKVYKNTKEINNKMLEAKKKLLMKNNESSDFEEIE